MKLTKWMIAAAAASLKHANAHADMALLVCASLVLSVATTRADTVPASADTRTLSGGADQNEGSGGHVSLYNNPGNTQYTWLNFDLSAYAGKTLTSDVTLTLRADASWGGWLTGVAMSTADAAWDSSTITWNTQPFATAVTGVANPSGWFNTGDSVRWTIPALTVQGWIANGYNGLCLTSGSDSSLHFTSSEGGAPPTLTFTAADGVISPADGVWVSTVAGDWTTGGNWLDGLSAFGTDRSATFAGVTGVAVTLDADRLIGDLTFDNADYTVNGPKTLTLSRSAGTPSLSVGGSRTVTIAAPVQAGTKGVTKTGGGTLVLAGPGGDYTGYTQVFNGMALQTGTVQVGHANVRLGPVTIENGATLVSAWNWATGGAFWPTSIGAITVNAGGTLTAANSVANAIKEGLTLNGGTVNVIGDAINDDWGHFYLASDVTVGGGLPSTVSARVGLENTRTFNVASGSALTVTGKMHNRILTTGGVIKTGSGTMTLTGNNSYSGVTDIKSGTLVAASSTALGTGGHDTNTMTYIQNGATLALQGNVILDERLQLTGAGVGGLGALRSLSGNNGLTQSGGSGGVGFVLDGNSTIGVDTNTLTVTGFYNEPNFYGGITKVGAGTLVLAGAYSSYAGDTVISNGTLGLSVTGGAARHFDASALGLANGANVTQWNDLSGNGAHATVPSGNANPTYLADAGTGTGLGAVSFLGNGGATSSEALGFARDTNVRSVFSVFKGASFLLTDSSTYRLHRLTNNNPADPLLVDYGQLNYLGKVYVNGAEVLPLSDPMPTSLHNGYNLVSVVGNGYPMELDSFNKDRIHHSGTQSHAETILYDYVVSETQSQQIEAYLNKKWFGIGNGVSNLLPTSTSVILANGSTLDLGGTGQTVAGLSGTGAVSNGQLAVTGLVQPGGANAVGTLTVPAGTALTGTLQVDAAADGACDVLAFQGAADLSGATLSVTETSSLDRRYPYTILTCSGTPTHFAAASVPAGWSVAYLNGSVKLATTGTLILMF